MLKRTFFHIAAAAALTFAAGTASQGFAADTSGTVLETMSAAGYTYAHVDSGVAKTWVAVPKTEISVGERISYSEGMEMKNFHSKSLDRTFPTIIFSSGLVDSDKVPVALAAATPADAPVDPFAAAVAREQQSVPAAAVAPSMGATSGGSTGAIVPFSEISVEKAAGDNGYTVEELFTKAKELNGKTVRVQAKVVKISPHIMGRNWLHLQDGSGNPMNNTHDLVATTIENAESDTVILLEGKLAADKDFGAGYKYDAIIEEAKIIK